MKTVLRLFAVAGLFCTAAMQACAATCSVGAVSLAFGNYDPFRLGHNDTVGNIAVTCSGKAGEMLAYSIALNAGGSGTFAARRMRSPSMSALNYNIYTTAARSTVWGDGNGGSLIVTDAFALPAPHVTRNYPVYGRALGSQNVPVGVYSDSIVVTLTF